MTNTGLLIFLYAETPLHAGSGTDLGAVDLPLQRERMSKLPVIQGSGVKGAWREELEAWRQGLGAEAEEWGKQLEGLFGPKPPSERSPGQAAAENAPEKEEFAGAISLTDARLLLLPARTVWGGWAWLTCPLILQRLGRDLEILGQGAVPWTQFDPGERDVLEKGEALIGAGSTVVKEEPGTKQKRLLIEDLDYTARVSDRVQKLAEWLGKHAFPEGQSYAPFRERLPGQVAVLSDQEFRFLAEHATEVVTRVRIDPKTGTVAKGALWTEENLPAESVLWSLGLFSHDRRKGGESKQSLAVRQEEQRRLFREAATQVSRIRLGGDRTVGRGVVAIRLSQGGQ